MSRDSSFSRRRAADLEPDVGQQPRGVARVETIERAPVGRRRARARVERGANHVGAGLSVHGRKPYHGGRARRPRSVSGGDAVLTDRERGSLFSGPPVPTARISSRTHGEPSMTCRHSVGRPSASALRSRPPAWSRHHPPPLSLAAAAPSTWSVLEQDVRSTESNPSERSAKKQSFLDGVASGSHPVLEGLAVSSPTRLAAAAAGRAALHGRHRRALRADRRRRF